MTQLTDENLVVESPYLGGVQRIYHFPGNFGLSLVNAPILHSLPFAWEAAVLEGVDKNGYYGRIIYNTPLSDGVEVFGSIEEANTFIARARDYFAALAGETP